MVHQLRSGSRRLAGALALALAVVSSASCLAAISRESGTDHHACCAAMADGCGSATVSADCCADDSPGLAPAARFTLAPVDDAVLLWLPSPVAPFTSAAFDPDASNPIGPPAYLLDSVFRI